MELYSITLKVAKFFRYFTTTTRILQGFAFLCKLGLLLFNPRWITKFKHKKEKRTGFKKGKKAYWLRLSYDMKNYADLGGYLPRSLMLILGIMLSPM